MVLTAIKKNTTGLVGRKHAVGCLGLQFYTEWWGKSLMILEQVSEVSRQSLQVSEG